MKKIDYSGLDGKALHTFLTVLEALKRVKVSAPRAIKTIHKLLFELIELRYRTLLRHLILCIICSRSISVTRQ
jgi:hypothetical protein